MWNGATMECLARFDSAGAFMGYGLVRIGDLCRIWHTSFSNLPEGREIDILMVHWKGGGLLLPHPDGLLILIIQDKVYRLRKVIWIETAARAAGLSKKQDCTAMSSAEAEFSGIICKLCSSNVDADTASRLWLHYKQNTLTEYQLADMFTKALPEERFQYLVRRIGMRCLTPAELEVLTKESA
ncbi:hypothetical protein Tco_0064937 [Tanacetum coccineum]